MNDGTQSFKDGGTNRSRIREYLIDVISSDEIGEQSAGTNGLPS